MVEGKDLRTEEIELQRKLAQIQPSCKEARAQARSQLNGKVKPQGSLGILEELAVSLAGIYRSLSFDLQRKMNLIFCADNGVYSELSHAYPRQISRLVTEIMAQQKGGGSLIAKTVGADSRVINLGIAGELKGMGIIKKVIRSEGTDNITQGPAMSRSEAMRAIQIGLEQVNQCCEEGYTVFTTGEIGLGNTTSSAAVISALTGLSPREVTGRGSGADDKALAHKIDAVSRALAVNRPDPNDVFDVMSKVGGFDIAAMTGAMLGAALQHKPMVIDGFISQAAALCAVKINPMVGDYLLPSHLSAEKGAGAAYQAIGKSPFLHLQMRLGEGTGSCLLFPLMDVAKAVLDQMASFEELAAWFPQDWPPIDNR